MKTRNTLPLKRWLWMIGVYCISTAIGGIACAVLVNSGKMTLDNSGACVAFSMLISGLLIGLLSKNLTLIWGGVALGIVILLNVACSILIFSGISNTFLLQNGILIVSSIIGHFISNRSMLRPKGKRRHRKYS